MNKGLDCVICSDGRRCGVCEALAKNAYRQVRAMREYRPGKKVRTSHLEWPSLGKPCRSPEYLLDSWLGPRVVALVLANAKIGCRACRRRNEDA